MMELKNCYSNGQLANTDLARTGQNTLQTRQHAGDRQGHCTKLPSSSKCLTTSEHGHLEGVAGRPRVTFTLDLMSTRLY